MSKKRKKSKAKKDRAIFKRFKDFKKDLLTLPNLLTSMRIFFVPFVLWLVYFDSVYSRTIAFFIYFAASVTDYFDGYFARKYKSISVTGKLLDPLADKFIVMLTYIVLLEMKEIPLIPVLLVFAREFYMFGIRSLAVEHDLVIAAGMGGKLKTVFQMFSIPFFLLNERVWMTLFNIEFNAPRYGIVLLWVSLFFSYQSAWVYTRLLKRRIFEGE